MPLTCFTIAQPQDPNAKPNTGHAEPGTGSVSTPSNPSTGGDAPPPVLFLAERHAWPQDPSEDSSNGHDNPGSETGSTPSYSGSAPGAVPPKLLLAMRDGAPKFEKPNSGGGTEGAPPPPGPPGSLAAPPNPNPQPPPGPEPCPPFTLCQVKRRHHSPRDEESMLQALLRSHLHPDYSRCILPSSDKWSLKALSATTVLHQLSQVLRVKPRYSSDRLSCEHSRDYHVRMDTRGYCIRPLDCAGMPRGGIWVSQCVNEAYDSVPTVAPSHSWLLVMVHV